MTVPILSLTLAEHFPSLGCIMLDNCFRLVHLFAHWFWLPLGVTPFWTRAGTLTLGQYLYAEVAYPWLSLFALACNAVVPASTWPDYVGPLITLVTCTLSSAVICTPMFQWSLTPFISPGWILHLLDAKSGWPDSSMLPEPPAAVPSRLRLPFWLLVLCGQMGLLHLLMRAPKWASPQAGAPSMNLLEGIAPSPDAQDCWYRYRAG